MTPKKIELNYPQILPEKFINAGAYLLDDVYQSKKIPDFDLLKGDEEGHTFIRVLGDEKGKSLMQLFALCYYNNPNQTKESAALVYGKIFLKHYELEQRILDAFHSVDSDDLDYIKNLLITAEGVLEQSKEDLTEASLPPLSNPKVPYSNLNLTIEDTDPDTDTHHHETFSKLLSQIDVGKSDDPKVYNVLNRNLNRENLSNLSRRMSAIYASLLVRNCMKSILPIIENNAVYRSRITAKTNMEAAQDFIQKGLGKGLSNGQCAYQIYLKYYRGGVNKDGEVMLMSSSPGDTKFNGLRRCVKKIRGGS